jgi:hypothetical protein
MVEAAAEAEKAFTNSQQRSEEVAKGTSLDTSATLVKSKTDAAEDESSGSPRKNIKHAEEPTAPAKEAGDV